MALLIGLGIVVVIFGVIIYDTVVLQKWHQDNRGHETITEADHFYWHLFYFNSDDRRIFVPKRGGGGFTINFANPFSIIAGVLIIAGLVAMALLV